MRWKLITNISHVDIEGARIWCHFITIDLDGRKPGEIGSLRQVRGGTWGGLPIFTCWIPEGNKVEIMTRTGGHMKMLTEKDELLNIDSGITITGASKPISVCSDDPRQGIEIEDIEQDSYPFAEEIDSRLFPYAGGTNYPRVVWSAIPHTRTSNRSRARF